MSLPRFIYLYLTLIALSAYDVFSRNVILEFKGSYLLPTNEQFRAAYHNGNGLYGPELTAQIKSNWYGFIGGDYLQKNGRYLGPSNATKLRLLPFTFGVKYFIPASDQLDFYIGLGMQTAYMHTKKQRGFVITKSSFCGLGGMAKVGAYIKLDHNFLLDLFFDYGFMKTHKGDFYGYTYSPLKSKLNNAIFGVGLGYCF